MYRTKNWLLIIFGLILVLTALGCPPAQNGDDDGSTDTPDGQIEPEPPYERTEEGTMDGDATDREGESEPGEDEEAVTDDDFEPTQETPLAPPAQPASGVEDVPEGTVGLAVSMTGTLTGPVALEQDISVTVTDEIHVQITIVNNTDETREFVFATSQKLDIIFNDDEGNIAYQWSALKRFSQVLNALTLEGRETWSHELTVPVGTDAGQLPEGTYNVVVALTGTPPVSFMASGVEIKLN